MVSRNQVDGLHQQIVVEVLVYFQQKVETHLSQSEGHNQSGNLQKEVSETFGFFFNLNVVKFREVRSNPVIYEFWLRTSQLLCVDEFEGLSPNVVKCNILCFVLFIVSFETKDPYVSEISEVSKAVQIFLL